MIHTTLGLEPPEQHPVLANQAHWDLVSPFRARSQTPFPCQTPLMLQLMVVYFGPFFLFGVRVGNGYRLWAALIGFVINYAAYFAEIYRGGIQSMPAGQYEAAQLLGYGKGQAFFKIILPQVAKRILPSVTNEVITLVKDTSLAFTISVAEMFTTAKALASSQASMMPFVAAGLFYYIFNLVVAMAMEYAEKKMSYYQ